jgi:hypothetical protein
MLMPPEDKFLQNEEDKYACQDVEGGFHSRVRPFKRLGQQVNEYVTEQAPDSEADQDENDLS